MASPTPRAARNAAKAPATLLLRLDPPQHVVLKMVDLIDAVANCAAAARGLGDTNADRGAVEVDLFAVERNMVIGEQQHVAETHVMQLRDRLGQVRQLGSPCVVIE